jgi:bacterioferritin-associated ferredoxin
MGYRHNQKPASSGQSTSTSHTGSKQGGFASLDPSKMGLDAPDWLAADTSSSPSLQPSSQMDQSEAESNTPSRTVLEGMKVVCICKGIKKRSFWQALDKGAQTKEEVNRLTGSGNGGCQGRRCGPRIMEMLRHYPS